MNDYYYYIQTIHEPHVAYHRIWTTLPKISQFSLATFHCSNEQRALHFPKLKFKKLNFPNPNRLGKSRILTVGTQTADISTRKFTQLQLYLRFYIYLRFFSAFICALKDKAYTQWYEHYLALASLHAHTSCNTKGR